MARLYRALADGSQAQSKADAKAKAKAESQELSPLASFPVLSTPSLTMQALADRYLAWLEQNRARTNWRNVKLHLGRWCEANGSLDALAITSQHLEAFRERLKADGHAKLYIQKHETSVRACFNAGRKRGWLPIAFKPFKHLEGIRLDRKALLESDLPTAEEVRKLFALAKPAFREILQCYYHTGARTHELIEARVSDFQPSTRQLALTKHKRSSTLREYRARSILLNPEAFAIIQARCHEREPDALLFPNRNGNAFTSCLIGDMFARLRAKAEVRSHITIYSFRHLWISEALMSGLDALVVAKMAGTSVKMIEQTYGHFRASYFEEAQARLDAMRRL